MGKYTLNGDDYSENSDGEQEYGNDEWDDGDVVMQDADPDDARDDADDNEHHQSPQPQHESLWSRALTLRVFNLEEQQDGGDHQEEGDHHANYVSSPEQEEDSSSSRMGPLHSYQLIGRAENGDLVPFHYHVYGGYPPAQSQPSVFTSCGWMLISLMAVLAHICYWYGPSVPPPHDASAVTTTNWHEFLAHEATVAWGLMVRWGAIVQYVGYWCFEAMSRESMHWYRSLRPSTTSPIAATVLDCHAPWQFDMNQLKERVHGQQVALDKLGQILDSEWNLKGDQSLLVHRVDSQQQRQYPLLFYIIGGPAVGKKQLAKSLARQFHGNDCFNDSFLLELNTPNLNDSNDSNLYEMIWNHAMDHPNGSIVLWRLDETDQSKNQVVAFLRDLSEGAIFSKTIILLTSSIGNPTIHKVLRKYGPTNLPLLELESFLRYELAEAYSSAGNELVSEESTSKLRQSTTQLVSMIMGGPRRFYFAIAVSFESWFIKVLLAHDTLWLDSSLILSLSVKQFSKVHILTMLPLDRTAMSAILLQRLQATATSTKLRVPSNTMQYLLDHGLDWNQWIHAKTDQLLLEYCPKGGRAVDPLMQRILASCPILSSREPEYYTATTTTTTLLLLDPDLGKFEMITCPTDSSDTLDGCHVDCQFVL